MHISHEYELQKSLFWCGCSQHEYEHESISLDLNHLAIDVVFVCDAVLEILCMTSLF